MQRGRGEPQRGTLPPRGVALAVQAQSGGGKIGPSSSVFTLEPPTPWTPPKMQLAYQRRSPRRQPRRLGPLLARPCQHRRARPRRPHCFVRVPTLRVSLGFALSRPFCFHDLAFLSWAACIKRTRPGEWRRPMASILQAIQRPGSYAGHETHLWFIGDPELPALEEQGQLTLHRWCQWVSALQPGGVYDGEDLHRKAHSAGVTWAG